jgi:hypothetical protein
MGFVPNALLIFKSGCKSKSTDYHDDMNAENEEKEKLIPNLFQNSVVVDRECILSQCTIKPCSYVRVQKVRNERVANAEKYTL